MAAKYFYVPYEIDEIDSGGFTRGMIVRATEKKKLIAAIDEETSEGDVPPEFVSFLQVPGTEIKRSGDGMFYISGQDNEYDDTYSIRYTIRYREPRPHPSLEAAMEDARSEHVYAPHLYRLDARGGLQKISIGAKSEISNNPVRKNDRAKNSHDPVASTDQMLTTLFQAARSIDDAGRAKRDNDRRAAVGTAQWELGQSWAHAAYSSLAPDDKNDAITYLYELGMLVHEFIADDKRPTATQVKEIYKGADRFSLFVMDRSRAANPRGARR